MGQVKTMNRRTNGGNNSLHHPHIAILKAKIRQQNNGGGNFLRGLIDAFIHRILLISVTNNTVDGLCWGFMLC
jgi:hypothetical protein